MKDEPVGKLLKNVTLLAFYSRICIIVLQFIFNTLIPDHRSDGFRTPATTIPKTTTDRVVDWLLGGFLRWDAQYFIHITIYGYVYENSLAFFPGFPIAVRIVAWCLQTVFSFINITSLCLISSILLNLMCFVFSTRVLFRLTYKELKNEQLAYVASVFFCINPASIFFSAPYSETLFSLFSFSVMLSDGLFSSCIFVALSSLVRSNGVINLGFPVYKLVRNFTSERKNCLNLLVFLCKLVILCVGSLSTFIAYQFYSYSEFCTSFHTNIDTEIVEQASVKSYILKGSGQSHMCNSFLPYVYIQNIYWDVGFLHYFQFKQIPNFALAFPIIYFAGVQCYRYFCYHRHLLCSLGLLISSKSKPDERIFVYVVHLFALLIVCLFFVHIQVSTRLLCSSSPALYWFCAKLLHSNRKKFQFHVNYWFKKSKVFRIIFTYCILYFVIGTALFCNFFPWT